MSGCNKSGCGGCESQGCNCNGGNHKQCGCNVENSCQGYCVGAYCYGYSQKDSTSNTYNLKITVTKENSEKSCHNCVKKVSKNSCSCNR